MQPENFYIREISPESAETAILGTGFDKAYVKTALKKYSFKLIKICGLSTPKANIIKQTALSAGADAAVHKEVITCGVEKTDLVLGGTVSQIESICRKLEKQPFKLQELSKQLIQQLKEKKHPWPGKKYIMGILNVTPDSFSDGGKYLDPGRAAGHARKMIEQGADIIDIGGESTRPFSKEVSVDEELKRILPVIGKIRDFNDKILISIDTRHSEVAQKAVEAGANIINDVSGLEWDENMASVAAKKHVPVVITHSIGPSETVHDYGENIVDAVYEELYKKTQRAILSGIQPENIIIDPGIGFAKTFEQNIELIKRIGEFKSLNYPVLIGLSRKSFMSKILEAEPEDTTEGNIALNVYAAIKGADIIRVHEVGEHYKALRVLQNLY